jgi:hypothetical protein
MRRETRRATDAGRLAVVLASPALARIFQMDRSELQRHVAIRHRTYLGNDLANTYRFYAWSVLAGFWGLVTVVTSIVARAYASPATAGYYFSATFTVFLVAALCAVLSALRSFLSGRLASTSTATSTPTASRAGRHGSPAKRVTQPERVVASRMAAVFVEPSHVDLVLSLVVAGSYLAGQLL